MGYRIHSFTKKQLNILYSALKCGYFDVIETLWHFKHISCDELKFLNIDNYSLVIENEFEKDFSNLEKILHMLGCKRKAEYIEKEIFRMCKDMTINFVFSKTKYNLY